MAADAPDLPRGPRLALVVGTAKYSDQRFAPLPAVNRDVEEMAALLGDPAFGGFTVTTVLDRPQHEVRRALGEFLSRRDPVDTILLYISGHGMLDKRGGDLYFAAVDTDYEHPGYTAVEASWLHNYLDDCDARRQILILDCCYSGAFGKGKGVEDLELERRLIGAGRGRDLLAACRGSERAFEENGSAPRSVFTAALIDGVRSGAADGNRDGFITVEEAFHHVTDTLRDSGANQKPQYERTRGEGKLVLALSPPPSRPRPMRVPRPPGKGGVYGATGSSSFGHAGSYPRTSRVLRENPGRNPGSEDPTVEIPVVPLARGDRSRPLASVPTRCIVKIDKVSRAWRDRCIGAVTFSSDGNSVAAGGNDKKARVWDAYTGDPLLTLGGHDDLVRAAAFASDGDLIVTAGGRKVHMWNSLTGLLLNTIQDQHGSVMGLSFSPDGSQVVVVRQDGVAFWEPRTGRLQNHLTTKFGYVRSTAFSPDGRLLATSARDPGGEGQGMMDISVKLWDLRTGQLRHSIDRLGHRGQNPGFAFSSDSALFAAASGSAVRLWDMRSGRLVDSEKNRDGFANALAFSPDGNLLAIGHANKVTMWSARPLRPLEVVGRMGGWVEKLAFSPNGSLLVGAGADNTLRIWG
jgi:WD40 repeat protein